MLLPDQAFEPHLQVLSLVVANSNAGGRGSLRPPREGGGTPLYGLYRYVQSKKIWFLSRFSHKLGIDFGKFGHK